MDGSGTTKPAGGGNWLGSALLQLTVVIPVLAFLAYSIPLHRSELTPSMAFFVAAVAVIDLIPVPGWGGLQLSLSFPVLLGVAILYEPSIAAGIAFLGSFDPRELRRGVSLLKAAWNRSQMALSILAGAAIYHRLAEPASPWTRMLPAILLAAVVAYGVNTLCVAAQTAVHRRLSVRSVLVKMHGRAPVEFLLSYIGLGMFGAVIARFYRVEGIWSVVVLLGPLVFARQMYFRSRAARGPPRRAKRDSGRTGPQAGAAPRDGEPHGRRAPRAQPNEGGVRRGRLT